MWGENWHKGVVGLVAGKLCEEFNRPVIAGTKVKDEITASARSISSFNIIQAITKHSEVLERYGGHAQAAGLTIKEEHVEVFKESIQSTAQKNIKEKDLELEIEFDTEISLSDIDWDLLEWLEKFRPFGFGNRTPRFIIRGVEIAAVDYVGKSRDHIRLAFINKNTGEYVSAIGFSLAKHFPNLSIGDTIDALFSLEVNEWNGNRSIQMKLRDLKVRD